MVMIIEHIKTYSKREEKKSLPKKELNHQTKPRI